MEKTSKIQARVTPEEKRHLAHLARVARRSEADVLRMLINSVSPEQLRPGVVRILENAGAHES